MPSTNQIAPDDYYKYPVFKPPQNLIHQPHEISILKRVWEVSKPIIILIPTIVILIVTIHALINTEQAKTVAAEIDTKIKQLHEFIYEGIFPSVKTLVDAVGLQIPRMLNEIKQLISSTSAENTNRIMTKINQMCSMSEIQALLTTLNQSDHTHSMDATVNQAGVMIDYETPICYSEPAINEFGVNLVSGFTGFTPISTNFFCTKMPAFTITSEMYAVTYSVYTDDCSAYAGQYFEIGIIKDDGRRRPFIYKLAAKIARGTTGQMSCSTVVNNKRGIFVCSTYDTLKAARNITMLTVTVYTLYLDGYLETTILPDTLIPQTLQPTSLIVSRSAGASVGNTIFVSVIVASTTPQPGNFKCPINSCTGDGYQNLQEDCNRLTKVLANYNAHVYQGVMEIISRSDGSYAVDITLLPNENYRYPRFADVLYNKVDNTLILVTDTSGWFPFSDIIRLNLISKEVISISSMNRFRATVKDGCPRSDHCPVPCSKTKRFIPGLINYRDKAVSGLLAWNVDNTAHPKMEVLFDEEHSITRDFLNVEMYIDSSSTQCVYWYGTLWCFGFAEVSRETKRVIAYQAWNVPSRCPDNVAI
uniref:Hemagglutinin glycoprotein n=1 Tax=Niviventer confucianus morbillivirus TaxID=3049976 RepID=A0A9Y1Z4F8_9MONO|nr:attachment glycoprotein [Niviventer confucianus morbillivirus]